MITPFDLMDGLALALTLGLLSIPVGLLDKQYPDQDWSERIVTTLGASAVFTLMLVVLVSTVWGVLTGLVTLAEQVLRIFFG